MVRTTALSTAGAGENASFGTTPRQPDYEVPDDERFMSLVRAVFTQRRKTMRNAIRNTTHISGIEDPTAVVDAADETLLGKRAGNVPPAAFARLTRTAAEVDPE